MFRKYITMLACCLFFSLAHTQSIVYTEPDRNDVRNLDFDIVGKLNNHYLIFKNNHNNYSVVVYDDAMKQVASEKLDFLPSRTIKTEVLSFRTFFYVFYEYQKRNVVYSMAAKIDGDGKIVGEPVELDTTQINMFMNNKIYTILYSEDKQKIATLKINTKEQTSNQVTTVLFDDKLNLIKKTIINVDMPDRNTFLTEFDIDNEGDLAFIRATGNSDKSNISDITLVTKKATESEKELHNVLSNRIYLDDIRLKIDNVNKNYLLASFYSKSKRGNIDGLYASLFSKGADSVVSTTYTTFNDDLRTEAKSEGNSKYAFNDFFLQNIVMLKDGGYVVAAEALYSSSRGSQYNRWDYLNNYNFGGFGSPYYYSPLNNFGAYGYGYYPWYRNGMGFQNTRYFADNVAILAFDSTAKLSWSNVIHKSQFDDNTDDFIGYTTMNTGNEVHFLYNETEHKNVLLSDQKINPGGKVERMPTLKNLDRGYEFMPRLGKQVAAKQMIIPCTYRNYICFAKVDYQ